MKNRMALAISSFVLAGLAAPTVAEACTRLVYKTGTETFITARSMDWYEDLGSDFWAFPRGMRGDGGAW